MAEAYIIDACRTPRGIGKTGKGSLAHMHPQHLAATVLKAIAERNDLDTADVEDVIWSTSTQNSASFGPFMPLRHRLTSTLPGVVTFIFCSKRGSSPPDTPAVPNVWLWKYVLALLSLMMIVMNVRPGRCGLPVESMKASKFTPPLPFSSTCRLLSPRSKAVLMLSAN